MREKAPELAVVGPNIVVDDQAAAAPVVLGVRPDPVLPAIVPPPVQAQGDLMDAAARAPLPPDDAEEPMEEDEVFLEAPEPRHVVSSLSLPPMAIAKPSVRFSSQVEPVNPAVILANLSSENRRERAKPLLDAMLKRRDIVSWDPDTGNIVLEGKRIPETSVTKIMDHISNHKPSTSNPPSGVTRTLRYMKKAGIDPNLVVNADLRKLMGKGDIIGVNWQRVFD